VDLLSMLQEYASQSLPKQLQKAIYNTWKWEVIYKSDGYDW
jgi:hypothetical protein